MLLLRSLGGGVGVASGGAFLIDVAFEEGRGDAGDIELTAIDQLLDLADGVLVVVDDALAPDGAEFDFADVEFGADGERVLEVFRDLVGDDAETWHGDPFDGNCVNR